MADANKKTIDATPTWEGMLPAILALIEEGDGSKESYKVAKEELLRMARLADKYAAVVKAAAEQHLFRVVFPVSMMTTIDSILTSMKSEGKVIAFEANTDDVCVHYEISFASLFSLYEFGWNQRENFELKGERKLHSFQKSNP